MPVKVKHIAELANLPEADTEIALRLLTNRSLAVPSEELRTFTLIPLVADYLRKKRPEVIAENGSRLEKQAYAQVVENGSQKYERFPILDEAWPTVAAALPRFLTGPNDKLQTVCTALSHFLSFTGRWDERIALNKDAEQRAIAAGDIKSAGWRALQTGWVYYLRQQSAEVLTCANRAEQHWNTASAGGREQVHAIRLRGLGYHLAADYPAAIAAFRHVVDIHLSRAPESEDVATAYLTLANSQLLSGNYDAAKKDYLEALRISKAINFTEGITSSKGGLASLALEHKDWQAAEALASEALSLSEKIGRIETIAFNCYCVSKSLVRQNKKAEALPYAQRAVALCKQLGSPRLASSEKILAECEAV